jgi:hypothetical protein
MMHSTITPPETIELPRCGQAIGNTTLPHEDQPEKLYNLAGGMGEPNNLAFLYRDLSSRLRQQMQRFYADLKANARPPGRVDP